MSATDSGSDTSAHSSLTRRLFTFGVIAPLTALSIGVDGGDIFQIVAIDNLELDPRALGIALGLGTLSIPVQIWAARIPLERARHNIRIHLWLTGFMALIVAGLIAFADPGSTVAALALVIAVLAEISVSVLLATSWQPVISYTMSIKQRQLLVGPGRAATGAVLLASVVLFGQLGQTGRSLFMVAVGIVALAVGWSLRIIPPPSGQTSPVVEEEGATPDDHPGVSSKVAIRNVFIGIGALGFASWPLMLTYVALIVWPEVNLGLLGAALALGSIVASALWRDPGPKLVLVIKLSAALVAICSVVIALIEPDVSGALGVALLVVVAVGAAGRSLLSIGLMELAHRRIDERNSVQVMTMLDVIGSTSYQLGFFVAGFLIAASESHDDRFNPFQLWLVGTALVLVAAISRLRYRGAELRS